jgi:chromosome segregation ATPase
MANETHEILVRDAFLKVKEDMLNLSSRIDGLNDNIMSLREDSSEVRNDFVTKDSFTSVEKDLITIRESTYPKESVDRQILRIDARISGLGAAIDKREALMADVKDIKNIRAKVDAANEKFISKAELKKLFDKLNDDLMFLDKRLSEIEEQSFYMEEVEKVFISKSDFKEEVGSLSSSTKAKLKEISEKVSGMGEDLSRVEKKADIDMSEYEKVHNGLAKLQSQLVLKEDLGAISSRLARIESAVAAEKKSRHELEKAAKQIDSALLKINSMQESFAGMENELTEMYKLTAKSASKEQVDIIKREISIMMDGLKSLSQLRKEFAELKKGHRELQKDHKELKKGHHEHRKVTSKLEKRLEPGKMQVLYQKLDPKRGI